MKHATPKLLAAFAAATVLCQGALANHPDTGDRVLDLGELGSGKSVINQQVAGDDFSDRYNFTVDGSLNTTLSNKITADQFTIEGLSLTVYDSSDSALFTLDGDGAFDLSLGAGDYYAVVTGEATGRHGGMYQLSFNLSPVPDAQTWMLMLGGLGVLGLGRVLRGDRGTPLPA